MDQVKKAIIGALGKYALEFDETVVAELEERVNKSMPDKPEMYAFNVARNWAIDQIRRKAAESRRRAKKFLAAEKERAEREELEKFRNEFDSLLMDLRPNLSLTQQRWMDIVRLSCFEGLSDADFARNFPGSSADARYQWKCRGIKLLRKRASLALQNFIEKKR